MRLLLDRRAVACFAYRTELREQDTRRYYCARAPYRAILVARNGLDLQVLAGQVVDVRVGNDDGWRDFVREGNAGHLHTKITIYRVVQTRRYDHRLSGILDDSPRDGGQE